MTINDAIWTVLQGQIDTPFAKGKSYRTFKELNIAASGSYVIRIVVPGNVILRGLELQIQSGQLKLETVVGGTAGGTFAEVLPKLSMNTQAGVPVVPSTIDLTAGGTHTGGTVIDVVSLKSDTNVGRATSVGESSDDERGIGPNTYYWRFTASAGDAVVGVFKARWTEA